MIEEVRWAETARIGRVMFVERLGKKHKGRVPGVAQGRVEKANVSCSDFLF